MEKLVSNIQTPGWYPTEEYSSYLTCPTILIALKKRFDQSLLNRQVVFNSKWSPVWRIGFDVKDTYLVVKYAIYNYSCCDYWESKVQPQNLFQGSLWHDVEYNEKNKIPQGKETDLYCSTCKEAGKDGCYCFSEIYPLEMIKN